MNLIALTDRKLANFYRLVTAEIGRRSKAATSGHDAATIIKGQEMGKRAVMVAAAGTGNHRPGAVRAPTH